MSHHEDEEERHLATLDELEATQEQITSYQGLLKEVPEIFERKFNERLKPLLDRNQQLIEERAQLLHQLHQTLPPAGESPTWLLPPAPAPAEHPSGRAWEVVDGRIWWLVGLAAVGIAFGMQLGRPLAPASPQPSGALSPGSFRQPPLPSSRPAVHPKGMAPPRAAANQVGG